MYKIALVDDSGILRAALRNVLESSGFSVPIEAESSVELFGALAKQQVQLVLLDVFFPSESGLDILSRLKKEYPAVKVLLITGLRQNAILEQAQQRGADGVLYKPFDTDELLAAIERVKA